MFLFSDACDQSYHGSWSDMQIFRVLHDAKNLPDGLMEPAKFRPLYGLPRSLFRYYDKNPDQLLDAIFYKYSCLMGASGTKLYADFVGDRKFRCPSPSRMMVITGKGARVRSKPGTDGDVVHKYKGSGALVVRMGEQGDWIKIKLIPRRLVKMSRGRVMNMNQAMGTSPQSGRVSYFRVFRSQQAWIHKSLVKPFVIKK